MIKSCCNRENSTKESKWSKISALGLRIRLKTIWQACSLARYCNLLRVETWSWGNFSLPIKISMRRTQRKIQGFKYVLPLIRKDSFSFHIILFTSLDHNIVSGKVVHTVKNIKDNVSYRLLNSTGPCWFHHSKIPKISFLLLWLMFCPFMSIYHHIRNCRHACINGPVKQRLSQNFACGPFVYLF